MLKFWSILLENAYLRLADPVLPFLTHRQIMGLAFLLELGVALLLLLPAYRRRLAPMALFVLVSTFLAYRFTRWLAGIEQLCPCAGALPSVAPTLSVWLDHLWVPILLLLGTGSLYRLWPSVAPEHPKGQELSSGSPSAPSGHSE
ncbi:MAG: hypothetical protein D6766_05825 [Verrucomicrobia bacterium]|nr:MAG: hypothetical protein D6766_05825 [Verrucomicrobiota bacterium]